MTIYTVIDSDLGYRNIVDSFTVEDHAITCAKERDGNLPNHRNTCSVVEHELDSPDYENGRNIT